MPRAKLFTIADLELPTDFYTRARGEPWWGHVHTYAEEMKAGAKFPPILVGGFEDRQIVVDGYHRVMACKKLKIEYIQGVLKKYDDFQTLLEDSVKANNHHGIRYTSQDKAHIADLLGKYGLDEEKISSLVKIPLEKLDNFTIRNFDGRTMKAPLARLVKEGHLTEQEAYSIDQGRFSTRTLDDVLVQLINYLEFGAYPWGTEKYDQYAHRIAELITPHL